MAVLKENGYNTTTSIYQSTHLSLPTTPSISLPDFLLSSLPAPPSKPAFVDSVTSETLTYSALRSLTLSIANHLNSLGIRRGDVILFFSPNSLHFPALSLAILSLGAVFSPANFLHTRTELASQVQDCNPSHILTTTDLFPKVDGLGPKVVLIETLLSSTAFDATPVDAGIEPSDTAALMYSSGTTGKSKGVTCTHANLINMAAALRQVWTDGPTHVNLCVLPLFHMFGFSVFVCGGVAAGATTVIMRKYGFEDMVGAVERHRVTRIPAVPAMVVQMLRGTHTARRYDVGSLTEVICSGAPIGREHMENFVECYPGVRLSQLYGLTETSGPVTLCDGVKGRFHFSIGRLIPSMEAKILDVRNRKALRPNNIGELLLRGPPVMQGYFKNPEATSLAIDEEGWLHTGDLCYIDTDGLIYIVDRIKELIKYKGYQVAPAELEEILSTHPDVSDVAVIPYPDEETGEIPMACVVRKAGSRIKEEDVISFMGEKVAPYKKIRKVRFVEYIPRSASGKILRRHLKTTNEHGQMLEISARL